MFTVNSKQIDIPTQYIQRFWNRVDIQGVDQCWPWISTLTKGGKSEGYGRVKIRKQAMFAHRLAYYLSKNEDPGILFVCHKCDNPACCNPSHLVLGTHKQNMRDMAIKGRAHRLSGETHHRSKLNDEAVRVIRLAHSTGKIGHRPLAKAFCVNKATIARIIKGKGWSHLPR